MEKGKERDSATSIMKGDTQYGSTRNEDAGMGKGKKDKRSRRPWDIESGVGVQLCP